MGSSGSPRYLNAGEAALVVEFGATADLESNDRVMSLDSAIQALGLAGVIETVPTYRSLMIHYDPLALGRKELIRRIQAIASRPHVPFKAAHRWTVPCCYDEEFAEDLRIIAEMTGFSQRKVVKLHSSPIYRVCMYGFAPGFCYLSGVPSEIAVSRRTQPRAPHPANTVLLGGGLTLISTFSMPTGWWLIGRTPEKMFSQTRVPSFLAEAGDELCFEQVDRATYRALEARVLAGEIVARRARAK